MSNPYWMIEKIIEGRAHWWIPKRLSKNASDDWNAPERWTTDSNKAGHYDDVGEALYVMGQDMLDCKATEHLDMNGPLSPTCIPVAGMTYRQWLIGQAVSGVCTREISGEAAMFAIRMADLVCELLEEERLKKSQQK